MLNILRKSKKLLQFRVGVGARSSGLRREECKGFLLAGYSLVEVIVYVALLASLSIFVVGSVLSIYKAFAKTRIDRALSLNGTVAMETMIRETRQAISIDGAASVFGASPGTLSFGAKKFFLSGGSVKVQQGTNPAEDLTSGVTATNLIFYRDTAASSEVTSEVVKIELTLEAGEGIFYRRVTMLGSAVIRGAY